MLHSLILFVFIQILNRIPFDSQRRPDVGLMLAHRLRRWTNIKPTLGQRLVFAGFFIMVNLTRYVDTEIQNLQVSEKKSRVTYYSQNEI